MKKIKIFGAKIPAIKIQKKMTIVKPSSKKRSKSIGGNKPFKSVDCNDVFSDVHVMRKVNSDEFEASYENEEEGYEGESQAPK